jgi:hexosaminidase
MADLRGRRSRLLGAAAALVLFAGPVPAAAQEAASAPPLTVPALSNWSQAPGSYVLTRDTRLVADGKAARTVAETLSDDLRTAGHGTVPVVGGGARSGDIVIDVDPSSSKLGAEGYELRAGRRLSVTGATGTGAFYGTRTLLQLHARSDRVLAGRTVDVPRYKERGVGVCACYIHISTAWLENLVRDMAYHKLNQLLLELKVKSDAHPEANTWGYYTKDEIRRLVALGEKYHVEIGRSGDGRGEPDSAAGGARAGTTMAATGIHSQCIGLQPGGEANLVVATRSVADSWSAEPDVACSPPVARSAAMAGPGGAG